MIRNLSKSSPLLGIVLYTLFMSACSPAVNLNGALNGKWIPNEASVHWVASVTNTETCQITFNPDGTFLATVPDYLMKTSDQCSGHLMVGEGQWSVSSKFEETGVQLNFHHVDGERINWAAKLLNVKRQGDSYSLYFYIGEEGGDRFVFKHAVAGNGP